MANILLAYHTVDGQTRKICETLRTELAARGQQVDIQPLVGGNADPTAHDVIVIGASIRYGKHNPAVLEYIRVHQDLLQSKPSAFFSVNLVARKPEKSTPETNPYVKKFLHRIGWQPDLVGVFGGNLDYQRYDTMDRTIIRLIMWLTGGPTSLQTRVEYTDWDDVRRFAGKIGALAAGTVATEPAPP